MNREIPIIADGFVDREFGTGAVKVTPAHDPHDYEAGIRHDLPKVTVIDDNGAMTESAGIYKGMDRFACRQKLVEQLSSRGISPEGRGLSSTTSDSAIAARPLWSRRSRFSGT